MDKVIALIPYLFYDLIARLVPGTAFLVALMWSRSDMVIPVLSGYGEATRAFFLLAAGYAAGLVLSSVSILFEAIWLIWGKGRQPLAWPPDIIKIADEIGDRDTSGRDVLYKMYAEMTLCENLLSGFLIVWLTSGRLKGTLIDFMSCGGILGLLLLLLVSVAWRMVAACKRAENLDHYWKSKTGQRPSSS